MLNEKGKGKAVGDDVTVNGTKLPWAVVIAVFAIVISVAGSLVRGEVTAEALEKHASTPAHSEAALATNTVQADVRHNREEISEIKDKLDKIEEQMAEDKDEILDAIREE